MTDLISRQDAIEAVMAEGRNVYTSEYANAERIIYEADAVEVLSLLPSARPTGEWIDNTNGTFTCDQCGCKHSKSRFCPNCGCMMEVEHDS